MGKNITMKDIAKEFGVSAVTVSKALSDKEGVSEEVREKIKLKATELGYRYNSMAKSMRDGINYNIGIVVAERFINECAFYSRMNNNLVKKLSLENYCGIMEIISDEDEKACITPNIVLNSKVDGIIVMGQMNHKYIDNIAMSGLPFMFLDFYDEHLAVDAVISDSVYGTYVLTNYLISMGHRKIGFVGDIFATSSIMDRYIGYYKSMLENRIDVVGDWIIKDRDEHGRFCELVFPKEMPTAFVCNCDEVAYTVVNKLKLMGCRVPEDVSVVGFDNYTFATLSDPQLTTIEVSIDAMAEAAVNTIINKVEDKSYVLGRKVISGKLIIRDSVFDLKVK